MTGGGTFNVTTPASPAGTFRVGSNYDNNAAYTQNATLDLTELKETIINLTTTGSLRVGPNTNQGVGTAVLRLPNPDVNDSIPTTTITANVISLADGLANGYSNKIMLGTGLTKFNVNTSINVGNGQRDLGQMTFAGPNGDLIIRAANGTGRTPAINLGNGAGGSGAGGPDAHNIVDFSGHDADILVATLTVGNTARTGIFTSEFKFGVGNNSLTGGFSSKLDATQVNIGFRTGDGAVASSILTNKVSLSGGTVTFGNVSKTGTGVDIGNNANPGAAAHSTIGELNISGGAVTIHNSSARGFAVRLGTNSNEAGALGTVTASMNLTGGTTTLGGHIIKGAVSPRTTSTVKISGANAILDMGGFNIGSLANSITLTAESGTLQNVGEINGGSGGLTKTTAGTLTLSGTNTYTGDTTVNEGVLAVSGTSIADTGKLVINGGKVHLTSTETVNTLFINGVQQTAGDYTSANTPTKFIGSGTLRVFKGLSFSSWITGPFAAVLPTNKRGPNDDPDNDGIINLVEFAIDGQDPTVSNPSIGSFNGTLLSFTKRQNASGLTYFIEESTDLGNWNRVGSYTENTVSTISYTLTPGTPVKNFARLQVTQAP
jgi:autotransporter-associated beta strand protein